MTKKINIGDTVYLLCGDDYSEHIVEEKTKEGNRFYYGLSECSVYYPRERIVTSKKRAEFEVKNNALRRLRL